jgi:pimeloyl-ACP methyl ester carboxylesterase
MTSLFPGAKRVQAGEVELGWREWGDGPTTVAFIHGNLASKDWISLAAPMFPKHLRVVGIDWRGCGDSDRPAATADYANYTMQQHADDMIAALDALGIGFCHLATHSTGGIIAARMMLTQPGRFGRVLALDPVSPLGLAFNAEQIGLFRAMMASKDLTRTIMATAAASLFAAESLVPGGAPRFRDGVADLAAFFERIVDQTFSVAEGIWIGTPVNLNLEHERKELLPRMAEIPNEHLVIWGEQDGWIPAADLRRMAEDMPHCRLVSVPGIGHSMNLEQPALYAGYFGGWFGGL